MKVIFFNIDNVLNFPDSDAVAPSGAKGVADASVKVFKKLIRESASQIVLVGPWTKEWDFDDAKCSPDGAYLNKKLNRNGVHIMDKTEDVENWLGRHPNVTDYCVLENINEVKWVEQ